ncbi:MAG TPA: hypothetical protein VMB79_14020 [Jatrophihabitans sp.]|nr:hypothetical protein [Jatrophihabitans sp.]
MQAEPGPASTDPELAGPEPAAASSPGRIVHVRFRVDAYALALAAIVAVQAVLIGVIASRGSFYADDLSYMSEATGRSLGWGYLTAPVNDHFVPGLRLVFWLMNRTTRLHYGVTIPVRIVLQAATTLLMYRLLVRLVGLRPGVLGVLAWYATSPLLIPGTVWLTTSVHLLSAQLFVVLALSLHVEYARRGRFGYAAGSAACLLVAVLFWEVSALVVLMLPILSFGFLHAGDARDRLRATLRQWPGLAAHGVLLGAWVTFFLAGSYGGSAHPFGVGGAAEVLRVGWLDTFVPALFGGPWHWFYYGDVYFPVAYPALAAVIVAQVLLGLVLAIALLRTGPRALLAWAMPVAVFVLGTLLVAVGRFWIYKDLTPRAFNYAFVLAVPSTVAAALSLLPTRPTRVPGALHRAGRRLPHPGSGWPWLGRTWARHGTAAVAVVTGLALLGSVLVTDVRFTHRWAQNPSQRYLDTLSRSVRAAGPRVNLWDGPVPQSVLAFFSSGNHISDVLHLAGVPARFDAPDTDPMVVNDDGTLSPGQLFAVAQGVQRPHTLCTALVQGQGSWTIPLSSTPTINEYFLKISYLQQLPSVLNISLRDATGRAIVPVRGSRTALNDQLGNVYFRLPLARPAAVVIRSESADARVCFGAVQVGVPLAVQK